MASTPDEGAEERVAVTLGGFLTVGTTRRGADALVRAMVAGAVLTVRLPDGTEDEAAVFAGTYPAMIEREGRDR